MTPAANGDIMHLPNAANAYIPPAKILDYLLSMESRRGRSKARFFIQFGFRREEWRRMADALLRHGSSYEVVNIAETQYGPTYAVDGIILTPDGSNPRVRTVWMIRYGEDAPRFVTAYPIGR